MKFMHIAVSVVLLAILVPVCYGVAYGSEDTTNWNLTFTNGINNDQVTSIAIDSNDNIFVVGVSEDITGDLNDLDWWIKMFDSDGNEDTDEWNLTFTNGINQEVPYSVVVDSSDNVYVGGGSVDITGDGNGVDVLIKKYSNAGVEDTTNWNFTFTNGVNGDLVIAMAVDSADNIYAAILSEDISGDGNGADWWIKKFYQNGTEYAGAGTNWNLTFTNGVNDDTPYAIAIDSADNVYVVGTSEDITGDLNGDDWLIKKWSNTGVEDTANWNITYTQGVNNDYARGIAIDSGDNVYVVGYADNLVGDGTEDWWIKKFYSNGTEYAGAGTNWNATFSGGSDDNAYSVAIDSEDRVYVVGYGIDLAANGDGNDWWIKGFSNDGTEDTTNWNKTVTNGANTDTAIAVAVDSVDAVYVIGLGTDITGNGNGADWWIKKYVNDDTSPSVDLDIADDKITTSQTTSITCSGSDTYDIQTTKIDVGSSTLASCSSSTCTASYAPKTSGTKTVTCTATDVYSNQASTTDSIRVSSPGAVASPSGTTGAATAVDVVAGELVSIPASSEAVESITLVMSESAENVKVSTESYESKPAEITAHPSNIYKYFSVNAINLDQDKIDKAEVDFRVSLKWVNENNLEPDDVALYRYTDHWQELQTFLKEIIEEDAYYTASTPGFSYFAIGEKSRIEGEPVNWVIYLVIAFVLGVGVGYYFYRKH